MIDPSGQTDWSSALDTNLASAENSHSSIEVLHPWMLAGEHPPLTMVERLPSLGAELVPLTVGVVAASYSAWVDGAVAVGFGSEAASATCD